jgi:hypothetical protein
MVAQFLVVRTDGNCCIGGAVLRFILYLDRKCLRLALWSRALVCNDVLTLIQWDGYLGVFSCYCLRDLGICSVEAACSGVRYFVQNCNTCCANIILWCLHSVFVLLFSCYAASNILCGSLVFMVVYDPFVWLGLV